MKKKTKKKASVTKIVPEVKAPVVSEEPVPEVKPVKNVSPLGDAEIKVEASFPDGKKMEMSYFIKNVHHNIPPVKLLRMGKVILKGLQSEYGMGVKPK